MTHATRFASLVTTHAIKSGYDLSSPRSGGRTALAADTGISPSSIGRMLNGQTLPDPYSLQALADAISLPVGLLLEEAGIVSPGLLTGTPPPASGPVTVAEVAASLGITKPLNVKLLEAITATLLADQATP